MLFEVDTVILLLRQQRYVLLIISSWSSRASFVKKSLSSVFVHVKEVTSYLFVKGTIEGLSAKNGSDSISV